MSRPKCCAHVFMCVYCWANTCVCVCVYMHVCTNCVCMCVCVCVCVCARARIAYKHRGLPSVSNVLLNAADPLLWSFMPAQQRICLSFTYTLIGSYRISHIIPYVSYHIRSHKPSYSYAERMLSKHLVLYLYAYRLISYKSHHTI